MISIFNSDSLFQFIDLCVSKVDLKPKKSDKILKIDGKSRLIYVIDGINAVIRLSFLSDERLKK